MEDATQNPHRTVPLHASRLGKGSERWGHDVIAAPRVCGRAAAWAVPSFITKARRRASSPVHQPQDTDDDEINSHDIVQQARDDQNQNAGDQGNERRERNIEIHKLKSRRGLEATSLPDSHQARLLPVRGQEKA